MGIEVTYRRLAQAEFDSLEDDPERAMEYFFGLPGFELDTMYQMLGDPSALQANEADIRAAIKDQQGDHNRVDLGKDWHALHFLLTGDSSDNPEHRPNDPLHNLVMGGKPTSLDATYGPVRKFEHDEIRRIVAALERISVDELRARFSPEAFNAAEIYPRPRPGGWDLTEIESVFAIFPKLRQLFVDALNASEVVIVYAH
jgi:Domain of unknown function (DUF1877)